MIKFDFNEVDWENYKYPGFVEGDTIRELVTGQLFRCKQVSTAGELNLGEEDVPAYYTFIRIDNPCGYGGTIWTNPELFELAQKRPANYKSPKDILYEWAEPNPIAVRPGMGQMRNEGINVQNGHIDVRNLDNNFEQELTDEEIREMDEQEARDIAMHENQIAQERANQAPDDIRQHRFNPVQQVNDALLEQLNQVAQANGVFADPVRPENAIDRARNIEVQEDNAMNRAWRENGEREGQINGAVLNNQRIQNPDNDIIWNVQQGFHRRADDIL